MEKHILMLMFVLVSDFGFSQEKSMKPLPVLFDTVKVDINCNRKRLEIKDTLLPDSLIMGFRVVLKFKYPLVILVKKSLLGL